MTLVDETFEVYTQMRSGGKEAKATLEALRVRIQVMQPDDRNEMVRRVKAWETQHQNAQKSAASPKPITPPAPAPSPPRESARLFGENSLPCPRCGKPNIISEVFCAHCGNFLRGDSSPNETTQLNDTDALRRGMDFFGPDSTLVLIVANNNFSYSVQPQRFKHETVIGRSEGSTMKPDIDLTAHSGGEMGVSRLHVALQYNAKNRLLSVSDMKSANGTYINGQKLYPQEVRVLRDGDELRLGRLVMRAYFRHPE